MSQELKQEITGKLRRYFGKKLSDANDMQLYIACASTVRDRMMEQWTQSQELDGKKLYYLSFEFLMGRSLGNNLINLGLLDEYKETFSELGLDFNRMEEMESDAGLGNGGLGRLAACYIDSLTTLGIPAYGSTIRYQYGLFKQKIVEGYQIELPDPWLEDGNVWEIPCPEEQVEVKFEGEVFSELVDGRLAFRHVNAKTILAVPYDMPICGYDSGLINTLRMWAARSPRYINMEDFNQGEYLKAMEEKTLAEVISEVLYPGDHNTEGKSLRLKQQYFFVSATMQWIVRDYIKRHGSDLTRLPEKVVVQINDTHPALAIPELMRILMDEHGMGWDGAFGVANKVFAYTNHTVMSEALEKWPKNLFEPLLPRIYLIVEELNRRLLADLEHIYPRDTQKHEYMAILSHGHVNMANLCLYVCSAVNGVSRLHTKILTEDIFRDYYNVAPEKFHAITNGVTFRRWLRLANPGLDGLITQTVGDVMRDSDRLKELLSRREDDAFLAAYRDVKQENKRQLAAYIREHNGFDVDASSLFDVQVKRLHEYKRQLLNALHILSLYFEIKDNPEGDFTPRTFIFGAKSSPSYHRAKLIIKLVNSVADLVNRDPVVREKMKVVFIENYGVSIAQKIVAAADVSEQISTAGMEASGTGNMKLMLNGAVTVGTLDGANVEISELVGLGNIYLFGLRDYEVADYKRYNNNAQAVVQSDPMLARVVDALTNGLLCPEKPGLFREIANSLLYGDYGYADPYMVLRDFADYRAAHKRIAADYRDTRAWTQKALTNTAMAGYFSSDRSVREYNEKIWHI